MSLISNIQNEKKSIDKLASQRILYSESKKIFYIQFLLVVAIAIFFPLLGNNYPGIKEYLAVIAAFYFLLDVFLLDTLGSSKKMKAAKIQELFDCEVLKIKWSKIVAGEKPEQEMIAEYRKKYPENKINELYDWYPKSVGQLPLYLGRTICQRANVWWDSKLRRKFAWFLSVITLLITVCTLYVFRNITLLNALILLAPFIPLVKFLLQQIFIHFRSASRLDSLKKSLDMMIESAIISSKEVHECDTRSVQDEIFRHRTSTNPIPDFFYSFFKKKYENLMGYNAEAQINEYTSKVKK